MGKLIQARILKSLTYNNYVLIFMIILNPDKDQETDRVRIELALFKMKVQEDSIHKENKLLINKIMRIQNRTYLEDIISKKMNWLNLLLVWSIKILDLLRIKKSMIDLESWKIEVWSDHVLIQVHPDIMMFYKKTLKNK